MPDGLLPLLIGGAGVFTVTVGYPLLLLLRSTRPTDPPPDPVDWPSVTMITAARNAAAMLSAKIDNFHALDYPAEKLSMLIVSDASTDETRTIVESAGDPRIQLVEQPARQGKAAALNRAVELTETELLLFSDADALLCPDAVQKLARHFSEPHVGGVCGQRATAPASEIRLQAAQQTYINLDSRLRQIESAHGRIGSNDGKIHMILRALYVPIPPGVSDDLHTLLAVVDQGFRFLFEPEATAQIRVPAKNARHEIQRRRRVVLISLVEVFRMKHLLNPMRYGRFAVGLWMNKIGRRLLPFFLLLAAGGAIRMLAPAPALLAGLLILAACVLAIVRHAQYILAGLIGTGWGVLEFLAGRRITSWEPNKTYGDKA